MLRECNSGDNAIDIWEVPCYYFGEIGRDPYGPGDGVASVAHPGKDVKKLTFKTKMAIRLLVTGAARTQKEAAEMAGIHPAYMPIILQSPGGMAEVVKQEDVINNATTNMSALISGLSRKALNTVDQIMTSGMKEENRLRAAIDLLDRNPVSSRTQKHQVESMSLSGRDAKMIAQSLVESAAVRAAYAAAAEGHYVRIVDSVKPKEITDGTGSDGA